jgi:hypothetical protein
MRHSWKTVLLFLLLISLTALIVINAQKQASDDEPDVSQFPIVDYTTQKPANLTEKQIARSKKYNSRSAPVIGEDSGTIVLISDWDSNLPALPVKQSAAVIVGEITDAKAQLSDDRTKIYSEFTVQIEQVLKNDEKTPLEKGNSILVERLGGRVRLPSGKIVVSSTSHQDLPRVGNRYLLFLTHEGPDAGYYEDLHILTGYEFRNGLVTPLDKVRAKHPINSYRGTTETSLLNDLASTLKNASLTQTK